MQSAVKPAEIGIPPPAMEPRKCAGTWLVIIVTLSFWAMVALGLGMGT